MIKSLLAAQRSEKVKFRIPRSVQQSIPIRCVYADGIWLVGNKHSKTWRFADVNYVAASDEDRRSIFTSYCAVLNSLPTDAAAKITIMNHRLNPVDFQRNILMREQGDSQDCYRKAFNAMLKEKSAASPVHTAAENRGQPGLFPAGGRESVQKLWAAGFRGQSHFQP